MRCSEATIGRVCVIRLEDGEILHETIERLASGHGIAAATVIAVGGADTGSSLIVGPADGFGSRAPLTFPFACAILFAVRRPHHGA